jgi:hypothetical protein
VVVGAGVRGDEEVPGEGGDGMEDGRQRIPARKRHRGGGQGLTQSRECGNRQLGAASAIVRRRWVMDRTRRPQREQRRPAGCAEPRSRRAKQGKTGGFFCGPNRGAHSWLPPSCLNEFPMIGLGPCRRYGLGLREKGAWYIIFLFIFL